MLILVKDDQGKYYAFIVTRMQRYSNADIGSTHCGHSSLNQE